MSDFIRIDQFLKNEPGVGRISGSGLVRRPTGGGRESVSFFIAPIRGA
jgi:hypothetical protein